jgi:8-oxo-dGTP pyrophosphatase MutT (NUDIX family)
MPPDPRPQSLRDAPKFKRWEHLLRANGLTIHGFEEVYVKRYGNGQVLFALLNVDATTPEGHKLLPLCFLKGEVVSVLVCLTDRETGEKFLLLVKQRRVSTGGYIYEHPAGMVDADDEPLAVAVREVREETGVEVSPEAVHRLNEQPYFPSTGTSDEALFFYYVELTLSREEIDALNDQPTGEAGEHEFIQTRVVPYADGKRLITNACGLLNLYLYEDAVRAR